MLLRVLTFASRLAPLTGDEVLNKVPVNAVHTTLRYMMDARAPMQLSASEVYALVSGMFRQSAYEPTNWSAAAVRAAVEYATIGAYDDTEQPRLAFFDELLHNKVVQRSPLRFEVSAAWARLNSQ